MTVIEMKMGAIYRAAHDVLPAKAADFSARADATSGAIDPVVAQLALAGNHPVAGDLADLSVELFVHLRSMVRTFNDTATALTEPPADGGTFAHQGLESYANDVVANRRDWTPPTVHV